MKKLVLASILASLMGVASAQTVSVYGIVDVNITSSKTDGAGTNTAMSENTLSTSRLGFKGTEDLGNGLKAEFQLESKLLPTTGTMGTNTSTTNTVFNREAWVGLNSASLGAVRLGVSDVTDAANIDIITAGQAANLGLFSTLALSVDKTKVVRYTTPTFAGFSAQVGYSNPDSTTTAEVQTNAIKSAFVKYEQGSLGVYGGFEDKQIDGSYNQKNKMVGAKYNFGVAYLGASYSVRDGATQVTADTGELKQTRVTTVVPVGNGFSAIGVYGKNTTSTEASTDNTTYKLAVTKDFSKRTTAYAAYINTNYVGATADNQTVAVGVRHSF